MVTLYEPGIRLKISWVVAPVFQEYTNGPEPPITSILINPVESP